MSKSDAEEETSTTMGSLELAIYKAAFRAARAHKRKMDLTLGSKAKDPLSPPAHGFGKLRHLATDDEEDLDITPVVSRPLPGLIAAQMLLARTFDACPEIVGAIEAGVPIVAIVEVPDADILARITKDWKATLGLQHLEFAAFDEVTPRVGGARFNGIGRVTDKPIAASGKAHAEAEALVAIQSALPILVFCPSAVGYVSDPLIECATHRLTVPDVDGTLVARLIGAVTGARNREAPRTIARNTVVKDLIMAVRFDRSPSECLERLNEVAELRRARRPSRDLALDELHGLDAAVCWGRSLVRDLAAWRRGEGGLNWDQGIDARALIVGPSGTGKTTVAAAIARAASAEYTSVSLSRWLASGHLGDALRAMENDFNTARAKTKPHFLIIDEIDGFISREFFSGSDSGREFYTQMLQAALMQLDSLSFSNEGIVVIGCANHVERCDPALLRPGRLNRVLRVGLPDLGALEKMYRVRLLGDLADADLSELCLLSLGSTGADVERIVKDSRRIARHEMRALQLQDLIRSVADGPELDDATRRRAAVHEAGHILIEVIHFGPQGVHAVVGRRRDGAGMVVRHPSVSIGGTYEDHHRRLQTYLAGRAAEHLLCGSVSKGAGGRRGGSDLELAAALAAAMTGSFGLAGPTPLLWHAGSDETARLMSFPEVRAAANAELVEADEAVHRLLTEHRSVLERIAAELWGRGRINGDDVADMIGSSIQTRKASPISASSTSSFF